MASHQINHLWSSFAAKHPVLAQFLVFSGVSIGVTILQLVLMPLLRAAFAHTALVNTSFQVLRVGSNVDGSPHFLFDYAAGALPDGGGGLAYFLAVEITPLIAQVINFFAQRNITFRSTSSMTKAAAWYALAYILITFAAAALQGWYKAPFYQLLIVTWGWGSTGENVADVVSMLINTALSFVVFFPIMRLVFKNKDQPPAHDEPASDLGSQPILETSTRRT